MGLIASGLISKTFFSVWYSDSFQPLVLSPLLYANGLIRVVAMLENINSPSGKSTFLLLMNARGMNSNGLGTMRNLCTDRNATLMNRIFVPTWAKTLNFSGPMFVLLRVNLRLVL